MILRCPPPSWSGRCEWRVPRPRLPAALEAGLAAALGLGVGLAPRPQVGPGSTPRASVVQAARVRPWESPRRWRRGSGGVVVWVSPGLPGAGAARPPRASDQRRRDAKGGCWAHAVPVGKGTRRLSSLGHVLLVTRGPPGRPREESGGDAMLGCSLEGAPRAPRSRVCLPRHSPWEANPALSLL